MAFRSRGLPSSGCNHCRFRKIRCDEGKPKCKNCDKVGNTDCKYRNEFERTWRSENDKLSQKAGKGRERSTPRTSREGRSSPTSSAESMTPERSMVAPVAATSPLEFQFSLLQTSPSETEVLARFFYDWSVLNHMPDRRCINWFNTLPTMYEEAQPDSLLRKAILALAYANYGQRMGDAKCLRDGEVLYGESLRMLKDLMVSDINTLPTSEAMPTVILLGVYETLVDASMAFNGSWVAHMRGASMLFNVPFQDQFRGSPMHLAISNLIFRQMLHISLVMGTAPAISMEAVNRIGLLSPGPFSAHTQLLHQTACLFADWKAAFDDVDTTTGLEQLSHCASLGMQADASLDAWFRAFPGAPLVESKPLTSEGQPEWVVALLQGPWAPQERHTHPMPVAQMLCRFYWEARLIIQQALLHTNDVLLQRASSTNPVIAYQADIESRLMSTIDRMCESCISPLLVSDDDTNNYNDGRSTGHSVREIPSLQGYLLLQILPVVGLCLDQVSLQGYDLSGRRKWIFNMRRFLRDDIGFTKGGAGVDPEETGRLPVQFWYVKK